MFLHHVSLQETKRFLSFHSMCRLCLCCYSISAVLPVLALLRHSMTRSVACVDAAATSYKGTIWCKKLSALQLQHDVYCPCECSGIDCCIKELWEVCRQLSWQFTGGDE